MVLTVTWMRQTVWLYQIEGLNSQTSLDSSEFHSISEGNRYVLLPLQWGALLWAHSQVPKTQRSARAAAVARSQLQMAGKQTFVVLEIILNEFCKSCNTALYIFPALHSRQYLGVCPSTTRPCYISSVCSCQSCPPRLLLHTCQEQKEGKKTSRKKSKGDFLVFAPGQHVSWQ